MSTEALQRRASDGALGGSHEGALARGDDGGLSRSQKAAAVLLAVGPDAAARVLAHLSEAEVEQVTLELATLGDLAGDTVEAVLSEFHAEAIAHGHLLRGGEEHARQILRKLRGSEGDEIVDRLLATVQTAPFHFLRLHDPAEVAQQLRDEHPQTLALIVAHLPTRFAAQVMADLDADLQADVALRVATLDAASPDVIAQVEAALHRRLGDYRHPRRNERGGVRELAALLNHSDRGTERAILGNLEAADPELAEQVRSLMFVFEDLPTLDDRAVQEVLRQVDTGQLALALKGVSADVRATVDRNLSERGRDSLAEELDVLGAVRVRDVEQAQSEIVRRIRKMEEEGTIVINRGSEGAFVE